MPLIGFSLMLGAIGVSWLGMIYGWGLAPQSWPWIIGSAAVTLFLMGLGQAMVTKD